MIICGFAGIGKSTLCKNTTNFKTGGIFIDLESTPFERDWMRYAKVAKHMNDQGYNVMLSCHEELRNLLSGMNIDYTLVIPRAELKDEYIARYRERGNTEEFIRLLDERWEHFTTPLQHENVEYLNSGEYLSDIYPEDKRGNSEV